MSWVKATFATGILVLILVLTLSPGSQDLRNSLVAPVNSDCDAVTSQLHALPLYFTDTYLYRDLMSMTKEHVFTLWIALRLFFCPLARGQTLRPLAKA